MSKDEPIWAQVLEAKYEGEQRTIPTLNQFEDSERHPLVNSTGLIPEQVHEGLQYLEQVRLLERRTDDYIIKPRGFDVAHEREMAENHDNTNRALAILTGGLFFAALVQALATSMTVPSSQRGVFVLGEFLFAAVVVGGVAYWIYSG